MSNRSSILIIFTGGTIGMIKKVNNYVPINFNELIKYFPEIDELNYYLEIIGFNPPIDSAEMSPKIWTKIVEIIEKNYTKFDGFVILHGTDTMAYTASAISFMLQNLNKPIVFTGSQLPIGVHRTDAKENLITSIEIAGSRSFGKAIVPEVCIYFENKLMRGNRTHKCSSNEFNAFSSNNYPILAQAGIDINYNQNVISKGALKTLKIHKKIKNTVGILKLFPGIAKENVYSLLRNDFFDAVILQTYGCGNTIQKKWFINELKDFNNKGKILINTSQCETGNIVQGRYKTSQIFIDLEIINSFDMTLESVVTKTMLLLGESSEKKIFKEKFEQSFCGELTKIEK
tara:strand:+ start:80 stop:1111 length:1032 start_codon:yes stop_codon:yes gene_type:complete